MLAALKPGFAQHCGLLRRDFRWNLLRWCLGWRNGSILTLELLGWRCGWVIYGLLQDYFPGLSRFLCIFFSISWGTVSCSLIFYVRRSHCAVPGSTPTANKIGHFLSHKPQDIGEFTNWSLRIFSAPEDGSIMFLRNIFVHLPYYIISKARILQSNIIFISRTTY